MKPQARPGEFTGVINGDRFELLPSGITNTADATRWLRFRDSYHAAREFQNIDALFPLQIDFELNSTCQMTCAFCVHGRGYVPARKLGWGLYKKAILEAESYGLCSAKFNYINEPLLLPDLPAYIAYAKDHGVLNTYLATNGLLLKGPLAVELITVGLDKVMISLDAVTPETFTRVRNSRKLEEIEANIFGFLRLRERLGTSYPLLRVNFLRTLLNAHEEEAFVKKWEGVADMVGVQTQVAVPGTDDDLYAPARAGDTFRCSFPFKLAVIDSAGDILPCCTFNGRQMRLGNLASDTIAEAWTSHPMIRLKALHKLGHGLKHPVCAHCAGAKNDTPEISDIRTESQPIARQPYSTDVS